MELHTLGVDGGYTQQDVIEVARSFTGWTITRPAHETGILFRRPRSTIPTRSACWARKFMRAESRMANRCSTCSRKNPHTAHHIALELAQHFVSDAPPERSGRPHGQKLSEDRDGDLREVMRTMIYSPEFWSRAAYRAKVKTPFELVVSTARALGADVDDAVPLVGWVGRIGEPLYQCVPPTGYSDKADAWVNSGALLNRLNYAIALASNRVHGSRRRSSRYWAPRRRRILIRRSNAPSIFS